MIIIGEKINGFIPRTKKAIEEKDEEYIASIAERQEDMEADYLDICAGTDPDVELETMTWLIDIAQANSSLPLCIDSSDPEVILECMKLCKKPGLINSVSMEEGKIDKIFPAIADTRWGVIALTCNNDGIPDDPATKLVIARQIMEKAREYGIADNRIYIDPLVTTLATKQDSMLNFMEGVRLIKEEFPKVHFTSGLSNISFGMPYRKGINMQFMCLAMYAGMDSAIVDPLSEDMQATIRATDALLGNDEYCMDYLEAYRDGMFPKKPVD